MGRLATVAVSYTGPPQQFVATGAPIDNLGHAKFALAWSSFTTETPIQRPDIFYFKEIFNNIKEY